MSSTETPKPAETPQARRRAAALETPAQSLRLIAARSTASDHRDVLNEIAGLIDEMKAALGLCITQLSFAGQRAANERDGVALDQIHTARSAAYAVMTKIDDWPARADRD